MRDPKRIEKVLKELKRIWKKFPHWRFGQIIFYLTESVNYFYVEDEDLIKRIRFYDKVWGCEKYNKRCRKEQQ